MQKDRDEKPLAIRKTELTNLLNEAVEHHNHVEAARAAVASAQQLALFHAWQAGIRLNKMKMRPPGAAAAAKDPKVTSGRTP